MPNFFIVFSLAATWTQWPSRISPVAFSFGIFNVRWYSLMYLAALGTVLWLVRWRTTNDPVRLSPDTEAKKNWPVLLEGLLLSFLGLLIGAKIGDIVFYNLSNFLHQPLVFLLPFSDGRFSGYYGMSFHGGLVGAILVAGWYFRRHQLRLSSVANYVIVSVPLGYFFGRLGNFLGGELYGRPTTSPLGMYFPSDPDQLLRHPSQLYEAFGEGILLFLILWPLRNHQTLRHYLLPLYLILYGLVRFVIEFFREPEKMVSWLTMGQWLCLFMIIAGTAMAYWTKKYSQPRPDKSDSV